jgi:hypothetical protein
LFFQKQNFFHGGIFLGFLINFFPPGTTAPPPPPPRCHCVVALNPRAIATLALAICMNL